jgi:hypothetical protein
MILFPVGQREKKSCQTESASRLRFRLVIRKKTRDAIARLFPVDQPGKYEREPISSSLNESRVTATFALSIVSPQQLVGTTS